MCACKKVNTAARFAGFLVSFSRRQTKQDIHQIFVETAVFFFSEKTKSSGAEYIKEDTKREKED